jgi:hypothetical protein
MWRTGTLRLLGFMSMTLGAVGCVIEEADDSAFLSDWDLAYVDNGGRVTCEDAGTPTVSLQARHLNTGSTYVGEFACSALRGISQVLPHGQYEATLSLLDDKKRPVSEISGGPFSIHRHGLTELPLIEFQVQAWELAWTLVRRNGAGTRFTSCAEAGVRTIELETQLASEPHEKYTFPCEDGEGITQAIRTGVYAYQLRLLDAGGNPLFETNVMSYEVPASRPALIRTEFLLD